MTPQEAIARMQNRDSYLAERIESFVAEGKSTYWLEKDREALALAISALNYVEQMAEYEAAQQQ